MKLIFKRGSTSQIIHVFLPDSTSTTGAGRTGVTAAGVTANYIRPGDAAHSSVSLTGTVTIGTYTSGGFKEVNAGAMPGVYEFHPPNAMLDATGNRRVVSCIMTAANVVPVLLEIALTDFDPYDANLGLTLQSSALDNISIDGKTLPNALKIMAATTAGRLINAGTGTETFFGLDSATSRVVASVDASGNRTLVTYP